MNKMSKKNFNKNFEIKNLLTLSFAFSNGFIFISKIDIVILSFCHFIYRESNILFDIII